MIDALMILLNPVTAIPYLDAWKVAGFTRAEGLIYLGCQSVLLGAYAAIRLGFLIKQRRVFKSPDDTRDFDEIDDGIVTNSYLLASKAGLKAHNS